MKILKKIILCSAAFALLCVNAYADLIVKDEGTPDTLIITSPDNNAGIFTDVSQNDWFYEDVIYVNKNKIMSGVSEDTFSPNSNITRAMMITILYRMADEPKAFDSSFSDIENGSWYEKAVSWGAENKIVSGTSNDTFSPMDNITREQLALMIYNYASMNHINGTKSNIENFTDFTHVASWATDALSWAVGNDIIHGKSDTLLAPSDGATRAETAAIIKRFLTRMT